MVTLIIALGIIIIYFSIESFLRYGKEAKSLKAGEDDKSSTFYLSRVFALNAIILFCGFVLNHYSIAIIFTDSKFAFIGIIIMIIGLAIRITATQTLQSYYTRTLKIQANQKIIDCGLYKYLRHPGYLGVTMLWTGGGLASNNYLVLIFVTLLTLIVYHYRIRSEEMMLIDAFKEDYINYQKRTWKIFPFIY